jgi:hypothetical protein
LHDRHENLHHHRYDRYDHQDHAYCDHATE